MNYPRLYAFIATSTAVIFALLYADTKSLNHVWFSPTRMWIALSMSAALTILYMLMMPRPLGKRPVDMGIYAGSLPILCVSLWSIRSQHFVNDRSYLQTLIPGHSFAIMSSERSHILDSRVRQLASRITTSNEREIAEMEQLITEME